MRQTQKGLLTACITKSARIQQLKNQIKDKRKLLEESLKRKSRFDNYHPDNQALEKAWLRTHKITVGTRRILVKETTSLFELKPGLIEEPETPVIQHPELPASGESFIPVEQDLYICGVTLSSRLIDVSKVPKEELNAPIGLVIHMLSLIVRYLGIKLPFEIIRRGIRPYIRALNKQHVRKFPLFLEDDEKNFKKFVHGMAMLNYDIAYVCHTQGIQVPICQVANTLQSLISISRAPRLGM
ncbi:UV radiation resistance protein/autophagy-related protein 14 [Mucor mucedo]|uniref:UV radiation resistance protein/autophagy-related protein 14 n=1 Tax=Mucor mucedo TaxID=29922 RepID=UPI0022203AE6|nr:UV radiation resistance protein/autophagy-related protein 14 [Mucor mucedo]KAI7893763.1 UV radiation resistance protein/autophagy-related protein 14 [Mucor mucedo]